MFAQPGAVPARPASRHPAIRVAVALVLALGIAPRSSAAPGTDAGGADAERMLRATDAVVRSVYALRGIAFRGKLDRALVSRKAAREHVTAAVRREYPPEGISGEDKMLERLGLLPAGTAYADLLLDVLVRRSAGFYDASASKLFVADWLPLDAQLPSLAHEICHALQDQRYGLGKLVQPGHGDSDRQRAHQALVEGDATALMLDFVDSTGTPASDYRLEATRRRLASGAAAGLEGAPAYLRETLLFPYVEGLAFVMRVRLRYPWSAVDALWTRPPESTEQVLHPDKYERREAPITIEPAPLPALGRELRLAGSDTLGEAFIRIWLAQTSDPRLAERAAAGWGGDRVAVYLPAGEGEARGAALAWLSAWDSEPDAEDFAERASTALAALAGAGGAAGDRFENAAGLVFALERKGTLVALILGVPREANLAPSDLLKSWRVLGHRK